MLFFILSLARAFEKEIFSLSPLAFSPARVYAQFKRYSAQAGASPVL
jgi:hypothetical protein